jgi:hypothetical protein
MSRKHVLLLAAFLLAATLVPFGVAFADEGDEEQCGLPPCNDGVSGGRCRTSADVSCNVKCNDLGCDGGSDASGEFNCGSGPWKVCQCGSCGSGGGGSTGTSGPGTDGGGGCLENSCWLECFMEFSCTEVEFTSHCFDGQCYCDLYLN